MKKSTYSLKEFILFVKAHKTFESSFVRTKEIIIKEIFNIDHVITITNRYKYMTKDRQMHMSVEFPKENCSHKLKRYITKEPPPYHYDYSISNNNKEENKTNSNDSVESLILMIKQEYGYGYRSSRMRSNLELSCGKSLKSSHSICNNHHSSSSSLHYSKLSERNRSNSLKQKIANGMYQKQNNQSITTFSPVHNKN